VAVPTLQDGGHPRTSPTPPGHSGSYPSVRPAQQGIVLLIIGVSSVIAVLLILVLWALLRD
jgi:hypothetical protein